MKWIQRTPLHSLVSGRYMLITVTGRKTGKIYETPVEYTLQGQTVTVITQQAYQWWKNLIGGAKVKLILRGKPVEGVAVPSTDIVAVSAAIHIMYPKMDTEALLKRFPPSVAIQIRLGERLNPAGGQSR